MSDQQPKPSAIPEPSILRIYLRGGGVLVLDQVIECTYRTNMVTRGLTQLTLRQSFSAQRQLVVGALDLSCVEAMVMERSASPPLSPQLEA
jgi:hypothetical protein